MANNIVITKQVDISNIKASDSTSWKVSRVRTEDNKEYVTLNKLITTKKEPTPKIVKSIWLSVENNLVVEIARALAIAHNTQLDVNTSGLLDDLLD